MSITSCIRPPAKNRYSNVCEWQARLCEYKPCATMLLSHFASWHDWKLRHDQYYRRANDIAEMNGDGRPHTQNAYLFFTTDELVEACMGLFGKQAVRDAITFLVSIAVISVHKNPNPRYHFDKTKYFRFFPEVCNRWIDENYSVSCDNDQAESQVIDSFDSSLLDDGDDKSGRRSSGNGRTRNVHSIDRNETNRHENEKEYTQVVDNYDSPVLDDGNAENGRPSHESGRAITDTTNNTTKEHTNNYSRETCLNDDTQNKKGVDPIDAPVKAVIESLASLGMPRNKLSSPDDMQIILQLLAQGADLEMFASAYQTAHRTTSAKGNTFNLRYLAKVVHGELTAGEGSPSGSQMRSESEPVYENYFSPSALEWIGDLVTSSAVKGEADAGTEQ